MFTVSWPGISKQFEASVGFGSIGVLDGANSVIPASFFARPVVQVARDLIGVSLLVDGVGGVIVETEAYDQDDPAAHSFRGKTASNAAMFGPAGCAYVYRSYGLHWCLNLVCLPGSAVLLRALEPTDGLDVMAARRGVVHPRLLCRGPGRLCQALAVTKALDAAALDRPPFAWRARRAAVEIVAGRRIGITRGVETPWRFCLAQSRFVSRGPKLPAMPPAATVL
jgi:DNA-3-methyladenine glycosylase